MYEIHTHTHKHKQRKIIEANAVIQDSGEKLVHSAIDLHRSRQIQKNLIATMQTLNRCAPGKTMVTIIRHFVMLHAIA